MTPEHQELINRIRASARAVQQAVETMPVDQQTKRPREGEWSVQEVLTHTLNAELLAFGLRIQRILAENDPVFPDYDETVYRETHPAPMLPVGGLVQMISEEHSLLARLLSNLSEASWQRQGRHVERGPMSIEFLARRMCEHAEQHARQISDLGLQSEI